MTRSTTHARVKSILRFDQHIFYSHKSLCTSCMIGLNGLCKIVVYLKFQDDNKNICTLLYMYYYKICV
jgi:hypothetical protein